MRKMTKLQQRIYDRVMKAVDYIRGVENKKSVATVDRDKLIAKWSPLIEKLGVKDPEKIRMLSKYAQIHSEHLQGTYKDINMDELMPQSSKAYVGAFDNVLLPSSLKIYTETMGTDLLGIKNTKDNDEIKQGSTDKD
jgi:hypothetical protein